MKIAKSPTILPAVASPFSKVAGLQLTIFMKKRYQQ